MPKRSFNGGDGLGVRKRERLAFDLTDFSDEVLIVVLSFVDSAADVIRASLTCWRLRILCDDDVLWRVLCGRLFERQPIPGLAREFREVQTFKWLAFAHDLWHLRPIEARRGGLASHKDLNYWHAGDSIFAVGGKALLHGYAFEYSGRQKQVTRQGLWWKHLFIESIDDMPESERGRADLNRPFVPEATPDGTGYAVIEMVEGTQAWWRKFYKGEWKDGKPHGRGRMRRRDEMYGDDEYEGEWRGGFEHGRGTKVHNRGRASSTVYTGSFFMGVRDDPAVGKIEACEWFGPSHALVRFVDGRVYNGQVEKGMLRGPHGRMTYPNGDVHTGDFVNGKLHGPACEIVFGAGGEWRRYTGGCFKGRFNDRQGKLEFADGSALRLNWFDGGPSFNEACTHIEVSHRSGTCECGTNECDAHRYLHRAAGERILRDDDDVFVICDEEEEEEEE